MNNHTHSTHPCLDGQLLEENNIPSNIVFISPLTSLKLNKHQCEAKDGEFTPLKGKNKCEVAVWGWHIIDVQ